MSKTGARSCARLYKGCTTHVSSCFRALAIACLVAASVLPALGQEAPEPPRLPPEARQFDFWVGHWDLSWPGGNGSNCISLVLDSAVVLEEFSGEESITLRGMSLSVYDRRSGAWKQTWVDNQGGYLDFIGGFNGQRMVLQRSVSSDGQEMLQRMVWYNITPDSLDWSWERSADQGKTWKTLWPIYYVRRK